MPNEPIDLDRRTGDESAVKIMAMLTGIASLLILLQGLWAGLMLDKVFQLESASPWDKIHQHAGETSVLVCVIAFVWALVKLRDRMELVIGSGALVLVMLFIWFAGHQMADSGSHLFWLHIPLALAAMALSVWLPVRAARR